MGWKIIFSFLFILFVITLLILYWFVPREAVNFGAVSNTNSNFSIGLESSSMQFYENMRYSDSKISYRINGCNIQKKQDMEDAFDIIANQTIISFNPVLSEEEISITCDNYNKIDGGLFIAGEGGPVNITKTDKFNVILNGQILLIKESECRKPNIAIHELLHAMGFDHSSNKNNIMYNISDCKQTIGTDILNAINKIYSIEALPDLSLENISAVMRGKYLDTNMSIKNNGLIASHNANLKIFVEDSLVKEISLEPLGIGYGKRMALSNLLIKKINIDELKFVIEYEFEELDKSNNQIILDIKSS